MAEQVTKIVELPENFSVEHLQVWCHAGTNIYDQIANLFSWFQNQSEFRKVSTEMNGTKIILDKS